VTSIRKLTIIIAICALAVVAAAELPAGGPARAAGPVQLAGTWHTSLIGDSTDECDNTFTQTKATLTVTIDSCNSGTTGNLTGTVNVTTGAFSLSGPVLVSGSFPDTFSASGTVTKLGLMSGTWSLTDLLLYGSFTGTKTSVGNDFSISAGGGACDTNPDTVAPSTCTFAPGSTFTVQVGLDQLDLPDNDLDMINGYVYFEVVLENTLGLPYQPRSGFGELGAPPPYFWPECDAANEQEIIATEYYAGCIDYDDESEYTGLVLEVDYTCNTSGTISLRHGVGSTQLGDDNIFPHYDDPSGTRENMQVNCINAKPDFRIVYDPAGPIPGMFTITADGSNNVQVTNIGSDNVAWSADGTKIAFESGDEIYRIDADGTNLVQLTSGGDLNWHPAWSPDGTRIAFASDRDDDWHEIYTMNATDGSGVTQLTNADGFDLTPNWSPDGTKIVFAADHEFPSDNLEIYTVNAADGSGLTQLTFTDPYASNSLPDWSNDGTRIAFASTRDGNAEIYTMNASGSGQTNRTNHPADDSDPAWKPSDSEIAFIRDERVHRMNADGTNVSDISHGTRVRSIDWRRTTGPGLDHDQDGCTDAQEAHSNPALGGLRSPQYFWDYFQVWTFNGSSWVRDDVIGVADVLATGARFGSGPPPPAKNIAVTMALTPPVNTNGYHIAYDRGAVLDPARPWKKSPPDGTINVATDIFGVAGQFGHNCL
jgi:hypothetical protein